MLGVITRISLPNLGTNKVDWNNAYVSNNFIAPYNDANGILGYPISGTAGVFAVIAGVPLCFAYFGNIGVYIGINQYDPVSEMIKIVD